MSVSQSPETLVPSPLPKLGPLNPSIPGQLTFKPLEWVCAILRPWDTVQASPFPTLSFPAPYLTDRPGVTQREEIDQLQEEMALTLDSYIKEQEPRPRNR